MYFHIFNFQKIKLILGRKVMKKKSILLVVALLLVLSTVLAACGKEKEKKVVSKDPKSDLKLADEQVLRLVSGSDIPSLDTSTATDAVSFIVISNVFEGLYTLGENDVVEPGVAIADPEKSADGKVWTIKLRKDAKWSNGDPVTAHDFVFGWRRSIDPETKSEYASMMYSIKNAEKVNAGDLPVDQLGVKATDDYTIEITWDKVYPYAQSLLAFGTFMPQNEKFQKSQGENYAKEANTQVFNGPFVLSSWTHAQGWTYGQNPNYWNKKDVKLEKIDVKVVKDDTARLQLFETGQIDRANLVATQVPKYKGTTDFKIENQTTTFFLKYNQKNELLANVDARKAISMGFDKKAFTDNILSNGSRPVGYMVPDNFAFDANREDFREGMPEMSTFDVKKAQEHWSAAKKALGKDTFTLEFLNYDDTNSAKTGVFMKEQLEKNLPGLTVNIKPQPFAQMLELQKQLQYDFTYAGWGPDYPDPMTFLELYTTENSFNRSAYSNTEYDKIIEDANGPLLADPAKRWEELRKAEKILIDQDQAIGPLYQRSLSYLEKPTVEGVIKHNFAGDYTYKKAYITQE